MRVGLFVTCLVDLMRPGIGFAALRLIEAAGFEVVVPRGQTCCGQPGWHAGDRASARRLAGKWLDEFEGCDYVVVPSGSCAAMIRVHYAAVFRDDAAQRARAERVAARTYELTEFLASVAGASPLPERFEATLTYHDSCAGLRELGIKRQPRELLSKVPGVVLREMPDCETCCGFGGAFSLKFGDIAANIAEAKCRSIGASAADAVVMGDLGCMLNVEGRLRRQGDARTRVLHVAEVLAGEPPADVSIPAAATGGSARGP